MHFSDIDLEGVFENRLSKWVALAFSTLVAIPTSAMLYSIVRYEEDYNHHRVLIGRLVSSNIQVLLFFDLTVQVLFISLIAIFDLLYIK